MSEVSDRSELTYESDPTASHAVELWEKGTLKEKDGSMTDAIRFYREALKINDKVEKFYRKKLQEEWELRARLKELDLEEKEEQEQRVDEDQDVQRNQDLPCWILEMLPNDLLLKVIKEVVVSSSESWVNLSLTCSAFNKLCFHNSVPYKAFADYIYPLQRYDQASMTLNGISNIKTLEETLWNNDYQFMINNRPYVKFQGVYISVVNYLRYGANAEGSSSLLNPIHMITYYRYFRFYPDGTCLRLLTTDEPSTVVKTYHKEKHIKHSELCRWSLSVDENFGCLSINRETEKYEFCEELQIKNQGARKHHRLKWIASSVTDAEGQRSEFSLKNEKPFFFSRVKSYQSPYHA